MKAAIIQAISKEIENSALSEGYEVSISTSAKSLSTYVKVEVPHICKYCGEKQDESFLALFRVSDHRNVTHTMDYLRADLYVEILNFNNADIEVDSAFYEIENTPILTICEDCE